MSQGSSRVGKPRNQSCAAWIASALSSAERSGHSLKLINTVGLLMFDGYVFCVAVKLVAGYEVLAGKAGETTRLFPHLISTNIAEAYDFSTSAGHN